MYIELLLIIDFLCFTGLLMLYYKTEKQAKALDNLLEYNSSLLKAIKLMNRDLGVLEENTEKEMEELKREIHIVEEGRIKDYCALKQDVREINKIIEYLYGEKK